MVAEDNIERFLVGQRFGFDYALDEIKRGRKTGHWIWYIFPQMRGLGYSPNSQYYGIESLDEARAYIAHKVLNARLREITLTLLEHTGEDIEAIMGGVDAMKLRSSMTLFDIVSPGDIYAKVLDAFYEGKRCQRTLDSMVQA